MKFGTKVKIRSKNEIGYVKRESCFSTPTNKEWIVVYRNGKLEECFFEKELEEVVPNAGTGIRINSLHIPTGTTHTCLFHEGHAVYTRFQREANTERLLTIALFACNYWNRSENYKYWI